MATIVCGTAWTAFGQAPRPSLCVIDPVIDCQVEDTAYDTLEPAGLATGPGEVLAPVQDPAAAPPNIPVTSSQGAFPLDPLDVSPVAEGLAATLVSERITRGALPVEVQILQYIDLGTPRAEVIETAHLVSTLRDPIPLVDFRKILESHPALRELQGVTVYTELPDGYPFLVTGPAAQGLAPVVANLEAFVGSAADAFSAVDTAAPETLNGVREPNRHADLFAEHLRQFLPHLPSRIVVIGFTLPLRGTEDLQAQLDVTFDFISTEVELTESAVPFYNGPHPLDDTAVSRLSSLHTAQATGG